MEDFLLGAPQGECLGPSHNARRGTGAAKDGTRPKGREPETGSLPDLLAAREQWNTLEELQSRGHFDKADKVPVSSV